MLNYVIKCVHLFPRAINYDILNFTSVAWKVKDVFEKLENNKVNNILR